MRSILSILIVLAVGISAQAQTTYAIKIKSGAGVGQTTTHKYSSADTGSAKFFDTEGKLIDEVKPEKTDIESRTTVLAVGPDARATKFMRIYKKTAYTKDGKNLTRSYEGRTLVFEKIGDRFRIGVAGKTALAADDITHLSDMVEQKGDWGSIVQHIAPAKPVKIGEEWTLDAKEVLKSVSDYKSDPAKSTIAAKLTKVFQKGKTQVSVIEVKAMIAVVSAFDVVVFNPPAVVEHTSTIEVAIDGSSTERTVQHTEAIRGKGSIDTTEKKGTMEIDAKTVSTSKTTAEVDDPTTKIVPIVEWFVGPDVWIDVSSKEHGFRASFPGTPKQAKTATEPPTIQYIVSTNQDKVAYFVMVTETKETTAAVMATFAAADTIKKKTEIILNGFSGVEFIHEKKEGEMEMSIVQRAYVVNDRIIQILLVHDKTLKVEQKKFFDSFKLLDKPKKDN